MAVLRLVITMLWVVNGLGILVLHLWEGYEPTTADVYFLLLLTGAILIDARGRNNG